MDRKSISLHPEFPQKLWVVIEQPPGEPNRFAYDPVQDEFTRTSRKSLPYERGFSGAYGWIGGTGTPPEPHFDVFLLTKQKPETGDILPGHLCGFFYRNDGDHKFIAVDSELAATLPQVDLAYLDSALYIELMQLYPQIGENEGWHGAQEAINFLKANKPVQD